MQFIKKLLDVFGRIIYHWEVDLRGFDRSIHFAQGPAEHYAHPASANFRRVSISDIIW